MMKCIATFTWKLRKEKVNKELNKCLEVTWNTLEGSSNQDYISEVKNYLQDIHLFCLHEMHVRNEDQ